MNKTISKMKLKDIGLIKCGFCGQEAEFWIEDDNVDTELRHHPKGDGELRHHPKGDGELRHHPSGICPARTTQVCDERLALKIWNTRAE